ncbi:MAG: hypothetical protein ACJ741_04165 [Pyrinomonadaceae bacterium]
MEFSIKIISAGSRGKATFAPDSQNAQADSVVSWNNTTNRKHQPWPTDANYVLVPAAQLPPTSPNYMSDVIAPGESSSPGFVTPQKWAGTIYYGCKLHPKSKTERGMIVVTVNP